MISQSKCHKRAVCRSSYQDLITFTHTYAHQRQSKEEERREKENRIKDLWRQLSTETNDVNDLRHTMALINLQKRTT